MAESSTKKGVLIGCGIGLAVMVCGFGGCLAFCGGGAFLLVQKTEAPASEARAFITAFGKGDITGARSHMSSAYKAKVTAERLGELAAQHPELKDIRDVTLNQRALTATGATVGGPVTTATGVTMVGFELVEEGKAWRVDEANIADTDLRESEDGPGAPPAPPRPPPPPAPPGP